MRKSTAECRPWLGTAVVGAAAAAAVVVAAAAVAVAVAVAVVFPSGTAAAADTGSTETYQSQRTLLTAQSSCCSATLGILWTSLNPWSPLNGTVVKSRTSAARSYFVKASQVLSTHRYVAASGDMLRLIQPCPAVLPRQLC